MSAAQSTQRHNIISTRIATTSLTTITFKTIQ